MVGSRVRKLVLPALALSLLLFQATGAAKAQGYLVLHSFDSPLGSNPRAPLVQGGGGVLFGTTANGGANGDGTVFRMDADGSNYEVLHDFNTTDGAQPESGLILASNDLLYGTTSSGGTSGHGTIFKIDTSGNNFSTIRHFDGDNDGEDPVGRLVQASDFNLYGVTNVGGANDFGTLYRIDLNGTTFTVIHVFGTSTEGTEPGAGVIQGSDGLLYGTTNFAAAGNGDGTIFRCALDGSGFQTLHTFTGPPNDGATPSAELLQASDGVLYGTTSAGGTGGSGTVFTIHRDGSGYLKLRDMGGADGSQPRAPLVEDQALLWGTTDFGGANNGGTLFHITRTGGLFEVVHDFVSASGIHATAVLVGGNRALYGTAENGGANGVGVAFRFTNPTVLSIDPTSGPATGGTAVTITGTLFAPLASVTIGGSAPTGVGISPTQITALTPALPPGTLNDVVVTNPDKTIGSLRDGFFADFLDVPQGDSFHDFVETLVRFRVTAGCGGGNYCRNSPVTRAQMAVFLLKGKHGPLYAPPPCTGVFDDVECSPTPAFAVDWIEALAAEGITDGCGGANYCPGNPVTRAQMAVFLLKGQHGSGYLPPACTGLFADVQCTPVPAFAVNWIEQLYNQGITSGCATNPLQYCPGNPVTRGQMAVFLVLTFLAP